MELLKWVGKTWQNIGAGKFSLIRIYRFECKTVFFVFDGLESQLIDLDARNM